MMVRDTGIEPAQSICFGGLQLITHELADEHRLGESVARVHQRQSTPGLNSYFLESSDVHARFAELRSKAPAIDTPPARPYDGPQHLHVPVGS